MLKSDSEFKILEILNSYDATLFCLGAKEAHAIILDKAPEFYVLRDELMDYLEKKEAYMNAEFVLHSRYCEQFDDGSDVIAFNTEVPFETE